MLKSLCVPYKMTIFIKIKYYQISLQISYILYLIRRTENCFIIATYIASPLLPDHTTIIIINIILLLLLLILLFYKR